MELQNQTVEHFLQAFSINEQDNFSRVCLQQFCSSLNADDAILSQLPIPPADAV